MELYAQSLARFAVRSRRVRRSPESVYRLQRISPQSLVSTRTPCCVLCGCFETRDCSSSGAGAESRLQGRPNAAPSSSAQGTRCLRTPTGLPAGRAGRDHPPRRLTEAPKNLVLGARGVLRNTGGPPTRASAPGGTSPCPPHATSPRRPPPRRTPAPLTALASASSFAGCSPAIVLRRVTTKPATTRGTATRAMTIHAITQAA